MNKKTVVTFNKLCKHKKPAIAGFFFNNPIVLNSLI